MKVSKLILKIKKIKDKLIINTIINIIFVSLKIIQYLLFLFLLVIDFSIIIVIEQLDRYKIVSFSVLFIVENFDY